MLLLLRHFSRVRLCATLQTAAHQAPLSLGFSRQEHWSGLPSRGIQFCLYHCPVHNMSFPGGSDVKHLPAMRETRVRSLGWEDLLEKEWHPTPGFLLENPTDGGDRWVTVHGIAKSRARLSDFTVTFNA